MNQQNTIIPENPTKYQETGRSTLILVLGLLSFVGLGPFVGIPAWIMGNKDLKKIKNGLIPITEKLITKIGMILGIISTFLFILIIGISILISINLYKANSVVANRDAVKSDIFNLGVRAQFYYLQPIDKGGGGHSFIGFTIPTHLIETANGKYSLGNIDSKFLFIIGIGKGIGKDGSNPMKVEIKVLPNTIPLKELN